MAFNDKRVESAEGHIGIPVKDDAGQTYPVGHKRFFLQKRL